MTGREIKKQIQLILKNSEFGKSFNFSIKTNKGGQYQKIYIKITPNSKKINLKGNLIIDELKAQEAKDNFYKTMIESLVDFESKKPIEELKKEILKLLTNNEIFNEYKKYNKENKDFEFIEKYFKNTKYENILEHHKTDLVYFIDTIYRLNSNDDYIDYSLNSNNKLSKDINPNSKFGKFIKEILNILPNNENILNEIVFEKKPYTLSHNGLLKYLKEHYHEYFPEQSQHSELSM